MRERAFPSSGIRLLPVISRSLQSVLISDLVIAIRSTEPIEFVDLTDYINEHLRNESVESGTVTVFSRHTTAAIKINEAEELLLEDFKRFLGRLCPRDFHYHHNDMHRRKPPIARDERPNAHSHCMHLLLSSSETVPVVDFRLALGRWQRVFMVELDGPREREVIVRCHNYAAPALRRAAAGNRDGRANGAVAWACGNGEVRPRRRGL